MKGYAIEIHLFEWKKSKMQKTVFKELKAHYLGSFSSQTGENTYKKLTSLLFHANPIVGTKGRRKKRQKLTT